jgi:hypothetical protein
MMRVIKFVLDELPEMPQVNEVSFGVKIIYVFRINQQKLCTGKRHNQLGETVCENLPFSL